MLIASKVAAYDPINFTRLNEAGVLDESFGENGVVKLPVGQSPFFPSQMKMLKNGRFLTLGPHVGASPDNLYVVRLLEDGQLDSTFGEGGKVTLKASGVTGAGKNATFLSGRDEGLAENVVFFGGAWLAISEENEKIYVSCSILSDAGSTAVIFCLDEAGLLDPSFNGGYVAIEQPNGNHIRSGCLAAHRDGVLFGGSFLANGSGDTYGTAFVIRYDQGGRVDTSFGDSGTVIVPSEGGRKSLLTSLAVREVDGMIVASGESFKDGFFEGVLTALNANGGFNLIFNNGKPLYGAFLRNLRFNESALQQQSIIVTGLSEDFYLMIARFNFDGSLDERFGGKGWVVFRDLATSKYFNSSLTADNKIVVIGSVATNFAVRYLG